MSPSVYVTTCKCGEPLRFEKFGEVKTCKCGQVSKLGEDEELGKSGCSLPANAGTNFLQAPPQFNFNRDCGSHTP